MTREAIIEKTLHIINQLPQEMATEVSDFADFIAKKYEEQLLTQNIQELIQVDKAFEFLINEEELYSIADLRERYND